MTLPSRVPGAPVLRVDLHTHSQYSDGLLSPVQLCALAGKTGLTHIALCDHDTLQGLRPMEAAVAAHNQARTESPLASTKAHSLTFFPGVELSTGAEGGIHLLGYGVQPQARGLARHMEQMAALRRQRFDAMLQQLSSLRIVIPPESLPAPGHHALGRAHLARALVRLGVVPTPSHAFDRFLARGRPAYVPYPHLSPSQAIQLLCQAGAVPVLAHPCRIPLEGPALFGLIASLQQEGLAGVEVYHPSASRRDIRALEGFARRHSLLVTGGSDYHGDTGHRATLGKLPPGWSHMPEDLAALMERMSISAFPA